jgi:hypothetical protein
MVVSYTTGFKNEVYYAQNTAMTQVLAAPHMPDAQNIQNRRQVCATRH